MRRKHVPGFCVIHPRGWISLVIARVNNMTLWYEHNGPAGSWQLCWYNTGDMLTVTAVWRLIEGIIILEPAVNPPRETS